MGVQISGGKGPINLNLTALIDISALIVIFLIMGTIFGQSSLDIPPGLILPVSTHNDSITSAPDIKINGNNVEVPFLGKTYNLSDFDADQVVRIENDVRSYLDKMPNSNIQQSRMMNLIAAQDFPYGQIFKIIKPFRAAGFETVLFVARGK